MVMSEIISQHTITYTGKLADDQIVDSQDLAYSILGAAKISISVIHYFHFGRVPKGNYAKSYQCVSRPPHPGSYEFIQDLIPMASIITENPQRFILGVEFLFRTIWKFLLNRLIKGPNQNTEAIVEEVTEGFKERDETLLEILRILTKGHDVHNQNLVDLLNKVLDRTVPEMAKINKTNAINFVQPIGNSCNIINNHFHGGSNVTIGAPEAEAIRSKGSDVVGAETEYECIRITELNLNSGHCILDILGFDEKVTGYISDPALNQPSNIYSTALDEHKPLRLAAKPILREGEVKRLYINKAHFL